MSQLKLLNELSLVMMFTRRVRTSGGLAQNRLEILDSGETIQRLGFNIYFNYQY